MTKNMRRNNAQPKNGSKQTRRILFNLAEKKNFELQLGSTTVSSAGAVNRLSENIVAGDDLNQRSGKKITPLHQHLKFRFGAVTTDQTCRVILFSDVMNTGVVPAVTDVLNTASYRSSYNIQTVVQQRRFRIHSDFTINSNLNGETLKTVDKTIRNCGPIWYNMLTAVAAANAKGAIFILVIGSNSTGGYDYSWSITYNDS